MNTKQKVLMIGSDTSVTGGMSTVIELYKAYNVFDEDAIFLPSHKRGSVFYRVSFFAKFLFLYLYKLIKSPSIKIVHVHSSYKGSFFRKALVLKIAKFFGRKTIFHLHGSEFILFYSKLPKILKQFVKSTLDESDLILVLSEQWKDELAKISDNSNVKVLYNPAVIKEIKRIQHDKINVTFMGILGKRKGAYDIIEAAKQIKNPDVQINLYGDGEVEEIGKLVIQNNLQDKIKLMGWISGDKKEEVLKTSDIYILPSYNEGLPMSILEAMAVGLPVISTPVGGIPEAVENDVNGFLIQVGDYAALAEKISLLACDKALRVQMGLRSYEIAKEKFDIKIVIEQLRRIYSEMLNN